MNIATAHATIELLASTWPNCFAVRFRDRKPLKIGIAKDVAKATQGAITPEELEAAFGLYTRQMGYLKVIREGAVRLDLDGDAAGTVTADQAAMARRHIERIRVRQSARTRARGLAIEKAKAEVAKRAAEIASGKRKPLLRMPHRGAAVVAQQNV